MLLRDKKKKRERQRTHADLIELFGAIDTEKAIQDIISSIQGRPPHVARVLRKITWRVTLWEVQLLGQTLEVEYDKFRKELEKVVRVADTATASVA